MDPVLSAARHVTGAVHAARQPADPPAPSLPPQRVRHRFAGGTINVKSVESEGLDQVSDGCTAVVAQVHRQDVTQFDAPQVVHPRTVACRYDKPAKSLRGGQNGTWVFRVTHVIDETSAAAPISPASPPSAAGTTRRSRMKLNPV
jgi:hypothetical protein